MDSVSTALVSTETIAARDDLIAFTGQLRAALAPAVPKTRRYLTSVEGDIARRQAQVDPADERSGGPAPADEVLAAAHDSEVTDGLHGLLDQVDEALALLGG